MLNPTTGLQAYDLRVDGRHESFGIASESPQLQWRMRGGSTPAVVRVQAASSASALDSGMPDLWDSGAVAYTEPRLDWSGAPLASGASVHWRVGLAADGGDLSWSSPARFGIALRGGADWRGAQWITHPEWATADAAAGLPAVETDFEAPAAVVGARLFLAAAGVVAVTINGEAAHPDVLAPGYARFDARVPAVAWDVSAAIRPGVRNVLRIELGTGVAWVPETERYSKLVAKDLLPRVLVRLDVESPAGGLSVVSGPSWRSALTATSVAHWFGGEDHDARAADHRHAPAATLGGADLHAPWWSEQPGLRITETVPGTVGRLADGTRIVDFGTNIAGWPSIELTAPAGTPLELWPGELLQPDGRVDQKTTGTPLYDTYITREGHQRWHPRFVYHGFRYLEVRGLGADDPDPGFEALVIRAANEVAGTFETDDEYLATLDRLIDRSIQGNMYSVFTDCPNREKLGWIEQLYLCFDALARHYDVDAHLRDAIVHMGDAQLESGSIPSIAPETVDFSDHEFNGDPNAFRDDPNWGGAIVFMPWRLYENYGDRGALERAWPSIVRYIDYLVSREENGAIDFGLGDWIALDTSTPRAMTATFGYLRALRAAGDVAEALSAPEAAGYRERADRVLRAFADRFHVGDDVWGSGSQGSYALALDAGAVPVDRVEAVRQRMLGAIDSFGGRLSVGENSWPSLMRVLHAMGRDDVTNAIVRNDEGPGYAWQVRHGATALAESWLGATGAENDNSQNHFMLGMVHDWMSQVVGGLAQAPDSVGWERALIAPTPVEGVTTMAVSYQSPLGRYAVSWEGAGTSIRLTATVPPGGAALVVLPDGSRHDVSVGTWEFAS